MADVPSLSSVRQSVTPQGVQHTLGMELVKRCVTNVGASSLTNKKKHQLLQFNYIILWISNSIELHRLRVCAHTNIFYVFPDGGAANGRTVFSVRGAAHGRTVYGFSKHRAVRLFA